ncbi:uncharacterized protein [Venturia canescens]|uniref:uncharacterized protein isoform X2 n=1 Tax=Venturia canescens TaxID=32260 RepID=UPI001C9C5B0D|nr:uncharacterized protein LOC122417630 isoform X2 [Venturia canescens]
MQICVGKLKDDPNNPDILDRIQEIQLHIVSLGRCQKQVVQRLRKEVDDFKAANANDVKVSVAALLGLNNNNHITANNESRNDDISGVRVASNGLDNVRLATAKEDYEDIVRNGDVTSRCNKSPKKGRSVSVETLSGDDEASTEHEQRDNKRQMSEEPRVERRIECSEQLSFLKVLGLITTHKSTELQNRRAERKRRSTANPQFVYSNWDVPTKKKRHSYLQSAGNVPQTRQTTARLNGPSPPPISNKPGNLVVPPKSTSPPTRASSKSLIPTQKATTRPNILRNMSESRVFPNKAITAKTENENESVALTCTATKTSQSTTSSKTVHIPGLPSGLTIERIENDSAVCINCRNPGILTNCVNCEANYHVSCHSISPPPPRLCPKCASKLIEPTAVIKKNDELAAASYAPGVAGKAGEDPEVDKTSRGFYKIGTNSRHQIVGASSCINKLSGSTFLIPVVPESLASSISIPKSRGNVSGLDDPRLNHLEPDNDKQRGNNPSNSSYTTTIFVNDHSSRSSVTYVPQTDPNSVSTYSYKLPIFNQPQTLYEATEESEIKIELGERGENETRPDNNELRYQNGKKNGTGLGMCDEGEERIRVSLGGPGWKQKFAGSFGESGIARGWKKSSTRAVPGLTRIVQSGQEKREPVAFVDGNNDNVDELQKCSYNGRSAGLCIESQQRDGRRTYGASDERREGDDSTDGNGKIEIGREREIENKTKSLFHSGGSVYSSKLGEFHTLLSSHNKPNIICFDNETSGFTERGYSIGKFRNDKLSFAESPITGGSEPFKLFPSTEHVKLEEAHLSAPPRAKLMRKIEENDRSTLSLGDSSSRSDVANRLLPNRRRTTEERRPMPRILMRNERKSLDFRDILPLSFEDQKIQNSPAFLKNYCNSFVRLPDGANNPPEIESSGSSDTSATEDAYSPTRNLDASLETTLEPSHENPRKNEELVTEERNEEDDESLTNSGIDDEETDDNEEDVEDEEDQDCPIVDDEIREDGIEGLRISTVSPESMQVLEQFEIAMKQTENGDKTANISNS